MSNIGITGTKNTFQGPYGFFRLYDAENCNNLNELRHRDTGQYGFHELLAELGNRFEVINLSMKPYPSCRATHPAIDGVLEMCEQKGIIAEGVKQVKIFASQRTFDRVGSPFSFDEGPLQVKAQFSIPYTVAVAIHKGNVFIEDFEEKNIRNDKILDLAKRVIVVIDKRFKETLPLKIEFETNNGRYFTKEICSMRGTPENPLSEEQMMKKFKKCFEYLAKTFSEKKIERIIQTVNHVEDLRNIGEITKFLS